MLDTISNLEKEAIGSMEHSESEIADQLDYEDSNMYKEHLENLRELDKMENDGDFNTFYIIWYNSPSPLEIPKSHQVRKIFTYLDIGEMYEIFRDDQYVILPQEVIEKTYIGKLAVTSNFNVSGYLHDFDVIDGVMYNPQGDKKE